MKDIAIVCDVMKDELQNIKKGLASDNMDYIFMEQHLHDTPNKMRARLQKEIDKVDDSYDRIILAYGLCSNGVVGLKSGKHQIVVPKVDDCISLFLGSKEKYVEEFKKDPATYYLCKGWIEYGSDPYRGYLVNTGQEDKIPAGWIRNRERYGRRKMDEETSRFLIAQMMRNYNRVLLIDNDDLEEIHRKYALDMVDFLSEVLGKKIDLVEIKGSSELLKKLFGKDWKKDNFIIKDRQQKISQQDFN
ncbi:MAG: DUF1638 domain-containing protein [Actinomycetota bacterium]